jgi:putative ABC transport system substrate-binding protein
VEALTKGLRNLGYAPGENFIFDFGFAEDTDRLREAASQMVRNKADVIFASTSTEVEAARQATQTVPIIFATHADPVGVGHVTSLPRPGGNITGLTVVQADLTSKAIEIFKDALPRAQRLGVIYSPAAPSHRPTLAAVETAAASLKLDILPFDVAQLAESLPEHSVIRTSDFAGSQVPIRQTFPPAAPRQRVAQQGWSRARTDARSN